MVTTPLLITYINQIAILFCSEATLKTVCRASVKQRLVNDFTNETFLNSFLPFLSTNRFYFYTLVRTEWQGGGKVNVVVKGYDVLTGKLTGHIAINGVNKDDWWGKNYTAVFSRIGQVYIDKKPGVGWLARVPTSNVYGIGFVPGSVPGGGGGGGYPGSGGSVVVNIPPVGGGGQQEEEATGFDFEPYLMPALLVGAGLALYYYFK